MTFPVTALSLATGYFLPALRAESQVGTLWIFLHERIGGGFVSASSRARLAVGVTGATGGLLKVHGTSYLIFCQPL